MGKAYRSTTKRQKMQMGDQHQGIDVKGLPGFGLCTLL
jgi:hypothetical protein